MMRGEYSVLKEVLKFHECGWSYTAKKPKPLQG
jgi:hypothetical protein